MPKAAMAQAGDPPIHPTARLEEGVMVEPGAVIGREAQIGRGTTIAAGARDRLSGDHRPRLLHRSAAPASRTPSSATGSSCMRA